MPCTYCGNAWKDKVSFAELRHEIKCREQCASDARRKFFKVKKKKRNVLECVLLFLPVFALFFGALYTIYDPIRTVALTADVMMSHPYLSIVLPVALLIVWLGLSIRVLDRESEAIWENFKKEFPRHAEIFEPYI